MNPLNMWTCYMVNNNSYSESSIKEDTYCAFGERIQYHSNITQIDVIPLFDDFNTEINKKLLEDIYGLSETLKYHCEIRKEEEDKKIDIDLIYNKENNTMKKIM